MQEEDELGQSKKDDNPNLSFNTNQQVN